jgi:hypothetical protein
MNKSFEQNKTKDNKLKVLCKTCNNKTQHLTLSSVNETGSAPMSEYEGDVFYWGTNYEIIQCLGCESISFRSSSSNSEDEDEYGHSYVTELIYPKRSKQLLNLKNFLNVPYNLQRIYRETIDCYNSENLTLCGAGVRALVEGLCKENGITGGQVEIIKQDGSKEMKRKTNLQGKINGLYDSGKLTQQNSEILHEHRFLGNDAVHELSIPSKEDLSLAIEIVESIFDTLYEIPSKGLRLKMKRQNP